MVSLIVAGNALAFLLTLAGECVLHASAVARDGSAVALLGGSGMGKSTLAALFCASGWRLVTDDLLRVERAGGAFRCFSGGPEVRLRHDAATLASMFRADTVARTADGRLAVRVANGPRERPTLRAVLLPRPRRGRAALDVTRLGPGDALWALMRAPRVAGVRAPELVESQFHMFATIAAGVPVFQAEIPWGPPFATDLPTALLTALAA